MESRLTRGRRETQHSGRRAARPQRALPCASCAPHTAAGRKAGDADHRRTHRGFSCGPIRSRSGHPRRLHAASGAGTRAPPPPAARRAARCPRRVRSACVPPQRIASRKTAATIAHAMPGWSLSTGAIRRRTRRRRPARTGQERAEQGDGAIQDHGPADVARGSRCRSATPGGRRPWRSAVVERVDGTLPPTRRTTSTISPTSTNAQPMLRSVSRRAPRAR